MKNKKCVYWNWLTYDDIDNKDSLFSIFSEIIEKVKVFAPKTVENLNLYASSSTSHDVIGENKKYSVENWEKFLSFVAHNSYRFTITDSDSYEKARKNVLPEFSISVQTRIDPDNPNSEVKYVNGIGIGLAKDILESVFFNEITSLLIKIATLIQPVSGYADYTYWYNYHDPTTINNWFLFSDIGKRYINKYADEYISKPRWSLLLTKKHIAKLGGVCSIKTNAPVYKTIDLSDGDQEYLILQATDNILHMTKKQYVTLGEYLHTLFPHPSLYELAWELKYYKNRYPELRCSQQEMNIINELMKLEKTELLKLIKENEGEHNLTYNTLMGANENYEK